MKTKAAIFLNGAYPPDHSYFYIREYKQALGDTMIIVTDGGLQFFINHELFPDLIIGDWDSADIRLLKAFPKALTITAPATDKAYTDGELAIQWCIDNSIKEVVLYGGIDTSFETDQLFGNVLMMFSYKANFMSIIMRDYCQEIIPLKDETISGIGKPGDMLSVIPISKEITYEAEGLKFDPQGKTYKFGETTPLRNELVEDVFNIKVKGKALLIRHF